ncbi:hypothetical protein CPE01_19910 [Cellulomonas persica]|uniref:Uncharacterized protein n=1 Tax=Cellulomonas persica TaxID=76861 RepID=A0A510UUF0_9CELL|nr:hypothetical protein CPE01_19910 [Cellulomonas persica]
MQYKIGRATKGYKVKVTVTTSAGRTCSTSFTPPLTPAPEPSRSDLRQRCRRSWLA